MLKRRIFLRTSILLLVMLGIITAVLVVFEIRERRNEYVQSYHTVAHALAGEIERLILWDDRVAVQLALNREIEAHQIIEYIFVVKDKQVYVDTFDGNVPPELLQAAPKGEDEPVIWEFLDIGGNVYYDIIIPIGWIGAELRLGIKRSSIDQVTYPALLTIAGLSFAVLMVGLVFSYMIALGATREVGLLSSAIRSFDDRREGKQSGAGPEKTDVVELVKSFRKLVADRKQAVAEMERARQFMQTVIDGFPEQLMVINRDFTLALANRAVRETCEAWAENSTCHKISHNFDKPCETDKHVCPMRQVVATREPVTVKHVHQGIDGRNISVEIVAAPIFDEQGEIVQIIESSRDITDREKLQAQLSQAQKMESVGRLAGGVAHDFNNVLGVILGYTEMVMQRTDPDQQLFSDLQEIRKAAKRSADLTRQLLAFARKQTVEPRVLNLNETIERMLKMLRRLIGEDIELDWKPGTGVWPVKIDPSQIDQVLANLCVNARDAITDIGKVTIETNSVTFDEDFCVDHPGTEPGDFVLLAVSDNGCGMDAETQGKLFEPFFTTKAVGQGTGLGLSTIYGIVKQNSGYIDVSSKPGEGSTFRIFLPRHESGDSNVWKEDALISNSVGNEVILLVEDDPAILSMTKRMLEGQNYTVLAASTPEEAIRLAEQRASEINLLITDVVMPEMNGKNLAERLQALYPHLKCLYMSGYTADAIAHHGVLDEGLSFIQKPFLIKDLSSKVRETLDCTRGERR